jgi:hypothetical protein
MAQHLGRRVFVVLLFLGAEGGSHPERARTGKRRGADDQRPGAVARRPKGDASE